MVNCGASIIKILLGVFNLLWLILGGGVVFIGYRLVQWEKDFSGAADLAHLNMKTASFAILAIGVVIVLISFLGFFGACCENSFMLNAYGFLMILMIGAQIYALVYAIRNNGNFETNIRDGIHKAIEEIKKDNQTAFILEELQYQFKCCGFKDKSDYNATTDADLPGSCCNVKPLGPHTQSPTCGPNPKDKPYTEGCASKLHFEQITGLFKGTIGVGVAIVMFELILVFAACCLAREIR